MNFKTSGGRDVYITTPAARAVQEFAGQILLLAAKGMT